MKNILLLITIILTTTIFSQERVGSFENDLKKSESIIREIIPIVNSKNKDVAVFIADAKNVYGYKLNQKFNITSKITSEEKRRKYKTLLGYSIPSDDNYKIILTNNNENKFLIVDFNFLKENTTIKEFVLESTKERIIQTLSVNNKFYLITAKPFDHYNSYGNRLSKNKIDFSDDFVNFYTIDSNNNLSKKEINLSEFKFIDKYSKRIKASSLLLATEIPKIDASIPNPINLTAKKSKLYIHENKIIFSFDNNNKFTQILEINLDNLNIKKEIYQKKILTTKRSNSFIVNDKIFIASSSKKDLLIEIIDIKTKKILKELTINENKNITFKNSPIVQRGGTYAGYRELKNAKQFLRKITAGKFGVSVLETDNKYKLSIGGYSAKSGNGMMMPGFGGIPIGTMGNISVFFNPTMFAYNVSSTTKSTQIDCLFNSEFDHIKGEIPENTFDKIDVFLKSNNRPYSDENDDDDDEYFTEEEEDKTTEDFYDDNDITEIFKINDLTILGSYDKSSKMYYFYKF